MTQYLVSVFGTESDYETPPEEMEQAYADVGRFNEELQASGAWVFGGGLHAPSTGTVVNATGAEITVTDGPYLETKEHIGGFWILEAADLDAALELAKKASAACGAPVEVRPFQDDVG